MPIGSYEEVSKRALDASVIDAALTLRTTFRHVQSVKAYLDTQTTEALELVGYSSDDVAQIKSMAADLSTLADIAFGVASPDADYNYFTFITPHLGIA